MKGLNRDQAVQISRLSSGESFVDCKMQSLQVLWKTVGNDLQKIGQLNKNQKL